MKFSLLISMALMGLSAQYVYANDATADEASEEVPEELPFDNPNAVFEPTDVTAGFWEQFTKDTSKRWISSATKKVVDGIEDDLLLRYRGLWNVEEASVYPGFSLDKGLVATTAASHHAISAIFPAPVDPTGKTFVAQYEVKFQKGLECGGAYMKLLTYDPDFVAAEFSDKSPYTIMFGPDKCGSTNKVHFIFRHKNPITGEFEEKALKAAPPATISKTSSVYTLVVRPDQSFEILINDASVKSGSLLKDFEPPVNPLKEINDPNDKKPADWIDVAKIPDPDASKPDDWDENASAQIPDEDAVQPDDWLVDEVKTIPDPEVSKPSDWDDEEDGDWTAPTIENPKCTEVSGCGPWTRPTKPNPDYKGKWKASMIDNPEYKGVWAPKKIPNPDFFEDLTPSNFNKIGAIGFELWTMQDGILFDNIYIGESEEDAKMIRKKVWDAKHALEVEKEKIEAPKEAAAANKKDDIPLADKFKDFLWNYRPRVVALLDGLKKDPVKAVKERPVVTGTLLILMVYGISSLTSLMTQMATGKKIDLNADVRSAGDAASGDATAAPAAKTAAKKAE